MTSKNQNHSGTGTPQFTKEQLKGADPKLAAAFIAFAERLGHKTRIMTETAESPKDTNLIKDELKSDADEFIRTHKPKT
ncbi:MAG: hypothetical protein WA979_08880 [Pacificimonas sp.]